MGFCSTIAHHVLSFVTFALAISIAVIVAIKFNEVDVAYDSGPNDVVSVQCLLGPNYQSQSLCNYVFIVAGISAGMSILISLVQCVTCHLCGLGAFLDTIFAAVGSVWWIVASSIVTHNITEANSADYPLSGWRTRVLVLMWVQAGCFVLLVIIGILRACCCA